MASDLAVVPAFDDVCETQARRGAGRVVTFGTCQVDELMTLAGRVSEESLNVIKADAGMPEFLRTVRERKLSAEDLMRLLPRSPA